MARLLPDGGLDPGFSGDGIQTKSISTGFSSDVALAMAVQADGKVLLAGSTRTARDLGTTRGTLVRFRADGSTDSSFGINGVVSEALVPVALAVQADGKIVSVSNIAYGISISRYLADGRADTSFGTGGKVSFTQISGSFIQLALQANGGILVGIWDNSRYSIVRFTAAGTFDAGFGTAGKIDFEYSGSFTYLQALVSQPDGRFMACGGTSPAGTMVPVLARFLADGAPDTSFGDAGWALDRSLPGRSWVNSVAIQTDGKIVTGGLATVDSQDRAVVARYLSDGSADPSFHGNGHLIYPQRFDIKSVLLGKNGAILVAGVAYGATFEDFAVDQYEAGSGISVSLPSQGEIPSGGSLDFGAVSVGKTGRLELSIQNSGSSPLHLGSAGVEGAGFVVSAWPPGPIPAGGTVIIPVEFTPGGSGEISGVLRISSDADNQPLFEIALLGTGNLPPVFASYAVSTAYQTDAIVSLTKLLTRAHDTEGDVVLFQSVAASPLGGSVARVAAALLYSPPAGFSGQDFFTVRLVDGRGGEIDSIVTVTVGQAPTAGGMTSNPPQLTPQPGGRMAIHFQGIPGRNYGIQRSTDMSTWVTLATVTANAAGAMDYTDPAPPQPTAFYRLALP